MKLPVSNSMGDEQLTSVVEDDFEHRYLSLRSKEQRLYTDEEVAKLPQIATDHVHHKEWLIRENSCQKLIKYLTGKRQGLKILEIGCGNGWLSSALSNIESCQVTGLDINRTELEQAFRIFHYRKELLFVYGDIRSGILNDIKFDIIIFAASIQYFCSLNEILMAALHQLKPGGEIHITDTRFYKKEELDAARERTTAYFSSMGFPGMSDSYFHHCTDELKNFHTTIFYNPYSLRSKILRTRNPFYWICIRNN